MALSNWDTFAINEKGEIASSLTTPCGVTVEFYKNWLYVRDEKAFDEKSGWSRDAVMQIESGEITYKDVKISARRGPKNGVYAVVTCTVYDKKTYKLAHTYILVGIGCYGYDEGEWVGVEDVEVKFLRDMMDEHEMTRMVDTIKPENYSDYPEDVLEEWRKEEADYTYPEEVRAIDLSKGGRFNQGDAYFASHVGFDVPATLPGEADPSILQQIFGPKDKQ